MIKILFVCHGNICRSPMAEFVMKEKLKRLGLEDRFFVASAATTEEEIWNGQGNPVYPPARRKLNAHGIDCSGKTARRIRAEDYERWDLLIGFDDANIRNMERCFRGDPDGKLHLLSEYAGRPDAIPVTVEVSEMMGSAIHVHCNAAGKDIVIIAQALDLAKENRGGFEYGSKLNFTFTGDVVHMFSKTTEENLL